MNDIDRKFLEGWAAQRNIPFIDDDYPMLEELIKGQGLTIQAWCDQQDKQQSELDKQMK